MNTIATAFLTIWLIDDVLNMRCSRQELHNIIPKTR